MYQLSRNLPNELIYKRKPNIPLGIAFFIIGVLGELFSIYIYFFILNNTSFAESSFILNLLMSEYVPLSFFITLLGALCLAYSVIELFFIKGWIVNHFEATDESFFSTFWKILFFTLIEFLKI